MVYPMPGHRIPQSPAIFLPHLGSGTAIIGNGAGAMDRSICPTIKRHARAAAAARNTSGRFNVVQAVAALAGVRWRKRITVVLEKADDSAAQFRDFVPQSGNIENCARRIGLGSRADVQDAQTTGCCPAPLRSLLPAAMDAIVAPFAAPLSAMQPFNSAISSCDKACRTKSVSALGGKTPPGSSTSV